MALSPCHISIAVHDLEAAREFYTKIFACQIGREAKGEWIDFNFYGHQLSVHLAKNVKDDRTQVVDGKNVPVAHFGIVLPWERWHALAALWQEQKVKFLIDPHVRFKGRVGEQATMFLLDPSGNAIELKSFQHEDDLFRAKKE